MDLHNKVILLVEDNPSDAELAMIGFRQHNLQNRIVHVKDGVEALDYLFAKGAYFERKITDLPQLVLLDIKLPKMDGLEVLRHIRANELTRRLPVVMLTSSREEQDVINSYDIGANAYIRKPVDFAEFSQAIKHLGIFWLVMNETVPPRLGAGGELYGSDA